jgi:hypothetical protein
MEEMERMLGKKKEDIKIDYIKAPKKKRENKAEECE